MLPSFSARPIASHPTSSRCFVGSLAANTNWRTASTEARFAFAVLTTERNAALDLPRFRGEVRAWD